jgi:hypothetical protein
MLKRYEKWKELVRISGPAGLRLIKRFYENGFKKNGKDIARPGCAPDLESSTKLKNSA